MATIKTGTELMTFTSEANKNFFTVTCSDSSWTVRSTRGWITVKKLGSSAVEVAVTANTGSERDGGVIVTSGTDTARVKIVQEGETVYYNNRSKINVYNQITTESCAVTCVGMCTKRSPKELRDAGFDINWADWKGLAGDDYSYELNAGTIDDVFVKLSLGYPVIAKVNEGDAQHWVVVIAYEGDGKDLSASNFTCADPWVDNPSEDKQVPAAELIKPLNRAMNFNKITKYAIYEAK